MKTMKFQKGGGGDTSVLILGVLNSYGKGV